MTTRPESSRKWRVIGTVLLALSVTWWVLALFEIFSSSPGGRPEDIVGRVIVTIPFLLIGLAMLRKARRVVLEPLLHTPRPASVTPPPPRRSVSSAELGGQTFTTVVSGYNRADVDRLLDQAAAALDEHRRGRDGSRVLSGRQVEESSFPVALGGVSVSEVDAILERIAKTLREHERREAARKAESPAREPSIPAPVAPPEEHPDDSEARSVRTANKPLTSAELVDRAKKRIFEMSKGRAGER